MQYCWHKLLSTYGNSQTTTVGTTISGRNLPIDHIEDSVGLYINTLPLIVEHDTDAIIVKLNEVQHQLNELNEHSDINLTKLQSGGRRLFDSLFVYENYPTQSSKVDSIIQLGEFKGIEELDYPLGVSAYEHNETIQINIKYAGELFSSDTIQSLLNGLASLLNQITVLRVQQQSALNCLDESNYQKIIYEWNQTEKNYPDDQNYSSII